MQRSAEGRACARHLQSRTINSRLRIIKRSPRRKKPAETEGLANLLSQNREYRAIGGRLHRELVMRSVPALELCSMAFAAGVRTDKPDCGGAIRPGHHARAEKVGITSGGDQ